MKYTPSASSESESAAEKVELAPWESGTPSAEESEVDSESASPSENSSFAHLVSVTTFLACLKSDFFSETQLF